MLGFPLGLLYANAGEWFIHKHMLHGLGRDKASFWAFHWHEHHREARTHEMHDGHYERKLLDGVHSQSKEAAALLAAAIAHAPLFPIAPFFTSGVWFSIANYYRVHKKSHQDPEWARTHLPWHYDHHMGRNQHANWCVSQPWFDWVMGTREKYVGTEDEARDIERKRQREARRASEDGALAAQPANDAKAA
jgi:sterol desaturase/sphingolipid hydroxylase (fatty acid hydroxylase superfamily)